MKKLLTIILLCTFTLGLLGLISCAEPCNHTYGDWKVDLNGNYYVPAIESQYITNMPVNGVY